MNIPGGFNGWFNVATAVATGSRRDVFFNAEKTPSGRSKTILLAELNESEWRKVKGE